MEEPAAEERQVTETEALLEIAQAIRELPAETENLRNKVKHPIAKMLAQLQEYDEPDKRREIERDRREQEQAKLYRLVVVFAALTALATVANVVIAVVTS